jgi:hypothetical protein
MMTHVDPGFEISRMRLSDLKALIERGEGHYLEFKRRVSSPEKIARELCAFANSDGGILLIGVDDDGTITGVSDHYEEDWLLQKAAQELCKPAISYELNVLPWQHSEVMIVRIPPSDEKPVYVYQGKKRQAFTRTEDESVVASEQVIELLKQQCAEEGVTFEYGENEQLLFSYLRENGRITVQEYAHVIHQTSYRASKILVGMVSAGILMLYTQNQTDYFTFAAE